VLKGWEEVLRVEIKVKAKKNASGTSVAGFPSRAS